MKSVKKEQEVKTKRTLQSSLGIDERERDIWHWCNAAHFSSFATIKAPQTFSQNSVTHSGVNKASGKRREGYAGMKDPPLMFLRFEDAASAWRLGGRLG